MTGYLGGHLTYSQGVGVDTTAFESGPEKWAAVADGREIEESRPVAVEADGVELVLVRQGGRVYALADRCTHRGGPLHEGELTEGCITCPWHGSRFRLEDGSVEQGPAVQPQPVYETRTVAGRIEVRRTEPKGLRSSSV